MSVEVGGKDSISALMQEQLGQEGQANTAPTSGRRRTMAHGAERRTVRRTTRLSPEVDRLVRAAAAEMAGQSIGGFIADVVEARVTGQALVSEKRQRKAKTRTERER